MYTKSSSNDRARIVVTGATGFLGRHILARLLHRGCDCIAAIRDADGDGWDRLARALASHQLDAAALRSNGSLMLLDYDLPDRLEPIRKVRIAQFVHVAASTRFTTNASGDPLRTNVEGTRRVLEWAAAHEVERFHLVSTAYVGGAACTRLDESVPCFALTPRNDYEVSKLQSEQLAQEWSRREGRVLTIHRPSVIVGDHASGATCKFDGFYLLIRATEFLARQHADATDHRPAAVQLRIEGRGTAKQNIVPVDWVARLICGIVEREELQGRVFNLVNPAPPTNEQIKSIVQRFFKLTGAEFVESAAFARLTLSSKERAFNEAGQSIRQYLANDHQFVRENTTMAEAVLGVAFPEMDEAAVIRLIDHAVRHRFGRATHKSAATPCGDYFERFLPVHLERSEVARITAMDVIVRFVIGDTDDYVCNFRRGRLVDVRRNCRITREDVAYHATHSAFWRAVSGTVEPQELFLNGEADMNGDVERALKLAMILNAFSREFPCNPELLRRQEFVRRSA